jgi:hypothetical protein
MARTVVVVGLLANAQMLVAANPTDDYRSECSSDQQDRHRQGDSGIFSQEFDDFGHSACAVSEMNCATNEFDKDQHNLGHGYASPASLRLSCMAACLRSL